MSGGELGDMLYFLEHEMDEIDESNMVVESTPHV